MEPHTPKKTPKNIHMIAVEGLALPAGDQNLFLLQKEIKCCDLYDGI